MSEELVKIIGSAIAGTLISSMLAKAYIAKSLRDLETALSMCVEINKKLAEINVKLEHLELTKEMVQEHDRKLIALDVRYGRNVRDY